MKLCMLCVKALPILRMAAGVQWSSDLEFPVELKKKKIQYQQNTVNFLLEQTEAF